MKWTEHDDIPVIVTRLLPITNGEYTSWRVAYVRLHPSQTCSSTLNTQYIGSNGSRIFGGQVRQMLKLAGTILEHAFAGRKQDIGSERGSQRVLAVVLTNALRGSGRNGTDQPFRQQAVHWQTDRRLKGADGYLNLQPQNSVGPARS